MLVLRWCGVLALLTVGVMLGWAGAGHAHGGVLLTVHSDGTGSVWVTALWRDGHPVAVPIIATLTATSATGERVGPAPLTPLPGAGQADPGAGPAVLGTAAAGSGAAGSGSAAPASREAPVSPGGPPPAGPSPGAPAPGPAPGPATVVRYVGQLGAGVWTAVVEAVEPGLGRCEAVLRVGTGAGQPQRVQCGVPSTVPLAVEEPTDNAGSRTAWVYLGGVLVVGLAGAAMLFWRRWGRPRRPGRRGRR